MTGARRREARCHGLRDGVLGCRVRWRHFEMEWNNRRARSLVVFEVSDGRTSDVEKVECPAASPSAITTQAASTSTVIVW